MPHNRTINTSLSEGAVYLSRCIRVEHKIENIGDVINKTINGDMFYVLPLLPMESVDLIIADPPYNLTKIFNSTKFVKKPDAEYEKYTRKWLSLVYPVLKPEGSLYVCCDWRSSLIIGKVLGELFNLRNRITWQREKGRGAALNWKNGLEDIWFATKSGTYIFNLDAVKIRRRVIAPYRTDGKPKDWTETESGGYRDTCPSNFWDDITIPFWSMPENTAHPAQKPEKLAAKIILASSNPGNIVFDPFLGSGTTSVAAKKLGRHYIGIEIEPLYCVWAEQRLETADHDNRIQGYTDGVFWERNTLHDQKKGKECITREKYNTLQIL